MTRSSPLHLRAVGSSLRHSQPKVILFQQGPVRSRQLPTKKDPSVRRGETGFQNILTMGKEIAGNGKKWQSRDTFSKLQRFSEYTYNRYNLHSFPYKMLPDDLFSTFQQGSVQPYLSGMLTPSVWPYRKTEFHPEPHSRSIWSCPVLGHTEQPSEGRDCGMIPSTATAGWLG